MAIDRFFVGDPVRKKTHSLCSLVDVFESWECNPLASLIINSKFKVVLLSQEPILVGNCFPLSRGNSTKT